MIWVTQSVHFNNVIAIIQNSKLNMSEKIRPRSFQIRNRALSFNLPNESPKWKVIIAHLKVRISLDCIAESYNFFPSKCFCTNYLSNFIFPEVYIISSVC
uniref:Uncharacterized protein n=1 Tax=Opuntia streptacantha TaxID=393608 RepID=A0A7C9E982_OPUST